LKKILREQVKREYAQQGNVSAVSERAGKSRCRRRREPSEEAAGQAAAIVDHDALGDSEGGLGLIWNHFQFSNTWAAVATIDR
jgi:hypothetical protein